MGLKKKKIATIDELKDFLREFFKEKKPKIYIFGSRARGDHTKFSDIDLGFLSEEDISYELSLLREIIEDSYLPYKVDIVDLSKDKELLEIVLKEGKRWF